MRPAIEPRSGLAGTGVCCHDVSLLRGEPVAGEVMEGAILQQSDRGAVGAAELGRRLHQRIEHGLKIERCTADGFEHVGGRPSAAPEPRSARGSSKQVAPAGSHRRRSRRAFGLATIGRLRLAGFRRRTFAAFPCGFSGPLHAATRRAKYRRQAYHRRRSGGLRNPHLLHRDPGAGGTFHLEGRA